MSEKGSTFITKAAWFKGDLRVQDHACVWLASRSLFLPHYISNPALAVAQLCYPSLAFATSLTHRPQTRSENENRASVRW